MHQGKDTATRIMDAAQRLAQTRGYDGFSYADIATEVGIRKASIHYHFPSKVDLGRELVARYRADFGRALRRIEGQTGDPRRRLESYAGLYRAVLEDGGRMCLCGMLAAEMAVLPEETREGVRGFFAENMAWLAGVLAEGADSGLLRFAASPETEAQLLISALEGGMLVARAYGAISHFDAVARPALGRLGGR